MVVKIFVSLKKMLDGFSVMILKKNNYLVTI